MKVGTLLNVNGRLATTTSDTFVKLVRTVDDWEMCGKGLDYGTASTFVKVAFNDNGQQASINLGTSKWSIV